MAECQLDGGHHGTLSRDVGLRAWVDGTDSAGYFVAVGSTVA